MTEYLENLDDRADQFTLPGVPDAFQRLWTPHRIAYIQGDTTPKDGSCVFCVAPGQSEEESLVVARGESVYAVLNLYPYNAGHLLICPYRHVANYDEISAEEVLEMGTMVGEAIRTLRAVSGARWFQSWRESGESCRGRHRGTPPPTRSTSVGSGF